VGVASDTELKTRKGSETRWAAVTMLIPSSSSVGAPFAEMVVTEDQKGRLASASRKERYQEAWRKRNGVTRSYTRKGWRVELTEKGGTDSGKSLLETPNIAQITLDNFNPLLLELECSRRRGVARDGTDDGRLRESL
jgi:hypothetical protein